MKYKIIIICCLVIDLAIIITAYKYFKPALIRNGDIALVDSAFFPLGASGSLEEKLPAPTLKPAPVQSGWTESFDAAYTVNEAGGMKESQNSDWWLSSGGYFYSREGIGGTAAGSLDKTDPWRADYYVSNPTDTDDGYHPQNIFRLVLKSKWQNLQQTAYFKITEDNLSASPNRNSSNGLLFFNRYLDSFNLYYTGIRVDGYATIKKKIKGVYYTLAYEPFIISGQGAYDRKNNPNLLPKNVWLGLRSEVKTNADNTVSIKLYLDKGRTGDWVLVAEAEDDGESYGGAPFLKAGHTGIRTDFMDVKFDDYNITEK